MHSDRSCDCRLGSERGGSRGAGGSTSTSLSNHTEADVACTLFGGDTHTALHIYIIYVYNIKCNCMAAVIYLPLPTPLLPASRPCTTFSCTSAPYTLPPSHVKTDGTSPPPLHHSPSDDIQSSLLHLSPSLSILLVDMCLTKLHPKQLRLRASSHRVCNTPQGGVKASKGGDFAASKGGLLLLPNRRIVTVIIIICTRCQMWGSKLL